MKISIPKPCHDNWTAMLPEEKGRFCLKCSKTVVDFSSKTKDEIKSFFKETTGKVCGRFSSEQLDEKPRFSFSFLNKRVTKFAFALYLIFGSFLFTSCSKKTELGEPNIENVKGDVLYDESTIGKVVKIDTSQNQIPQKKKVTKFKKDKNCSTSKIMGDTIVFPIEEKLGEVMITE